MNKPAKRLVYSFAFGPLLIGLASYGLIGLIGFYELALMPESQRFGQLFIRVIMRLFPSALLSFLLIILPATVFGIVFVKNLHREHMRQNILCGLFVLITFLLPLAIYLGYSSVVVGHYHKGPAETAEFLLVCFAILFLPLSYGLLAFLASFLFNTLYFQEYRKKL